DVEVQIGYLAEDAVVVRSTLLEVAPDVLGRLRDLPQRTVNLMGSLPDALVVQQPDQTLDRGLGGSAAARLGEEHPQSAARDARGVVKRIDLRDEFCRAQRGCRDESLRALRGRDR